MVRARSIFFFISLSAFATFSLSAQEKFSLPKCGDNIDGRHTVGDRLKVLVPKGAKTNTSREIDYAEYTIGFRGNSGWDWMSGIYGPSATSGQPPRSMTDQTVVSQREWVFKAVEGVDVRGRSRSGNYWRYIGTPGEAIKYFDVSKQAAEYFDKILDGVCFDTSGGIGL